MNRFTRGLWPLTVANVKSFYRDRTSVFWTFAFPIIFVILFGSIFSGRAVTFNVGWVDQDRSTASQALRAGFAEVSLLSLKDGDLDPTLQNMRNGGLDAVIVVPAGLGDSFVPGQLHTGPSTQLSLYTDPSRQTAAMTIQQVLNQVVAAMNLAAAGVTPVVDVANEPLQTQSITSAAYFVPSILAMALMQLGVFAAIPLAAQREKGILRRLNATPLPRATLVASNVIMRLSIGVVQTILILGIGALVFGVTIVGNVALAAGIIVLGALTFLSIGYVIASYARSEESANAMASVVQFPLMFLSGIFFPIAFMPDWLQPLAAIMPLTYLGDALRQVMVGGGAYAPLQIDVLVLGAWLAGCFLLSARFFRWS
jgi:ABC-2 type transport system permease protein